MITFTPFFIILVSLFCCVRHTTAQRKFRFTAFHVFLDIASSIGGENMEISEETGNAIAGIVPVQ